MKDKTRKQTIIFKDGVPVGVLDPEREEANIDSVKAWCVGKTMGKKGQSHHFKAFHVNPHWYCREIPVVDNWEQIANL